MHVYIYSAIYHVLFHGLQLNVNFLNSIDKIEDVNQFEQLYKFAPDDTWSFQV